MTIMAPLVISLREGIEVALIIAVMMSYLRKSGQMSLSRYVMTGTAMAIVTSIGIALLMAAVWGDSEGPGLDAFEGIVIVAAAVLLTTMILWMWKMGPRIASDIEASISRRTGVRGGIGLVLLSFTLILREGTELVLFSMALAVQDAAQTYIGVTLGLLLALVAGVGIYQGSLRISLRSFFRWTSVFLVLFAAGMVAYGIQELQDGGLLLIGPLQVWDINPLVFPDGSYPLLHENGLIGGLAKALFGYDGNPSALMVAGYISYLFVVSTYYIVNRRRVNGRADSSERQVTPVSTAE
jgi:high-affinity iron transporter